MHVDTYIDKHILPLLAIAGVETVEASFSGEGDSGAFDTFFCSPNYDVKLDQILIPPVRVEDPHTVVPCEDTHVDACTDLAKIIEEITMAKAAESGVDWYNNDGGCGKLLLDTTDRSACVFEVDVRIVETRTEHIDYMFDVRLDEVAEAA